MLRLQIHLFVYSPREQHGLPNLVACRGCQNKEQAALGRTAKPKSLRWGLKCAEPERRLRGDWQHTTMPPRHKHSRLIVIEKHGSHQHLPLLLPPNAGAVTLERCGKCGRIFWSNAKRKTEDTSSPWPNRISWVWPTRTCVNSNNLAKMTMNFLH